DASKITRSKHDRIYYKLQMDYIDMLGTSELGNFLKNIVLQFDTPFSSLTFTVQSMADQLAINHRYRQFAIQVHAALYRGAVMDSGPALSDTELTCLGEMVGRVEKLCRAADRRAKRNKEQY
ncbi:hypothetical protein V1514DRAFT_275074, partial [Lipomyces japonicus]|uniref:uncharacterized protein n=1 Tax=Lipomyces japonicus TaxID=56871 RepID=UPI0034CECA5B